MPDQWTQIEELAKRATPRPLKVGTDGLLNRYILSADDEIVTYFPDTSKAHGKNGDDFAYLVLACNAAPDMARRLRRIREVLGFELQNAMNAAKADATFVTDGLPIDITLLYGAVREACELLEETNQ